LGKASRLGLLGFPERLVPFFSMGGSKHRTGEATEVDESPRGSRVSQTSQPLEATPSAFLEDQQRWERKRCPQPPRRQILGNPRKWFRSWFSLHLRALRGLLRHPGIISEPSMFHAGFGGGWAGRGGRVGGNPGGCDGRFDGLGEREVIHLK
jgi:hypothetical protein